ncbi:MAG: DUF4406 domain-containing protein [Coriobacteriaceae bacterium]|nr:DUF4406 domain-containing protein [Coriobacteriaceae bacterium]
MKKAYISQPMRGLDDAQIDLARSRAEEAVRGDGYDPIDRPYKPSSTPLEALGRSLASMADADAAYFCKGWESARGCRIEHQAAVEYGIECLYE